MAALCAFLLFAGAAVYIFVGNASSKGNRSSRTTALSSAGDEAESSKNIARIEAELHQLEQSIRQQAQLFFQQSLAYHEAAATTTSASPMSSRNLEISILELQPQLDAWMREAEQSKQQRSERQRKVQKLQDAQETLEALLEQEQQRNLVYQQLETDMDRLETNWRNWLQSFALSTQLSPDAALETIQAVEQGHELLRQLRKQDAKLEMLLTSVNDYEKTVASLLGLQESKRQEPVFALKHWKEHEQEQLKFLSDKQYLDQLNADIEQELTLLEQTEQQSQTRLDQLLHDASALHAEELRRHHGEQEERKKRIEERAHLEASLEVLVSKGLLDSFSVLLETHGEEDLLLDMATLQNQLADTSEQTNNLREEVGKLAGQIEKLEQGSAHADQLLQLEACRTLIRTQVQQYAVASFASLLMKKARDVYEQERQPGVLLRASDYFAVMTGGAFTQVKAPFGEQRLVAIRANGQSLDTSQLSRGTAEQLYLSMRFALAGEYAGKAILPLVMDDILVNFDEQRMESCLRVLADLSSRHQILLFTCHGHVRDAAARIIPGHRFIHL
ncbi:hypothetical protein FU659_00560 [Paenibacillus sp. N3.4]|nr:hypothetical protein FU659_00560 [Paenibacillus sp. N3.4]